MYVICNASELVEVSCVIHNENSRVKIPALVHLTRLGYEYLSLKQDNGKICTDTNIFKSLFWDGVKQNNQTTTSDFPRDLHLAVSNTNSFN